MKILKIGCGYRHPAGFSINRPQGSGDFLLLIIKSEAFAVLDGQRGSVPQNSAILFQKGTPQLYGSAGAEFVNDWMHFEPGPSDTALIGSLGVPLDAVIPLTEPAELSDLLKSIFREYHSQNPRKAESAQRYFELILLKLSEQTGQKKPEETHPCYPAFCRLRGEIRLEPQSDWRIGTVSKRMNLSRSYLQHLYKAFFGTSITSDVRAWRMEHAKNLLSSTDMTVASVACSCGYDSDVHFMRVFKETAGVTPSAFRARSRLPSGENGRQTIPQNGDLRFAPSD